MRYEVRRPDGKLIGLYNGPDNMPPATVLNALPRLKPIAGYTVLSLDDARLPTFKEVVLERHVVRWACTVDSGPPEFAEVHTLVKGKRTWLNDVRGFRRI